ncbi:hypothetical protein [Niastella vici]|nr:hypothetical protein [Niastella vici]
MRYFLMMVLLLASSCGLYSQGKRCTFAFESLILPDSITSLQLLDTIKNIPLKAYNRKGRIPRFIKEALNCWTGGFDIANPGHAFYISDAVGWWPLPHRQLMYLGLSDHYMLMAYKHGGIGFNCPVIFIKFDNKKIVSVWYWMWFDKEMNTKENILQSLKRFPEWPNRHYFL